MKIVAFLVMLYLALSKAEYTIPDIDDLYRDVINELKHRFNETNVTQEFDPVIEKLDAIADLLERIDAKIPIDTVAKELVKELDLKKKLQSTLDSMLTKFDSTMISIDKDANTINKQMQTSISGVESSIATIQTDISEKLTPCKDYTAEIKVILVFSSVNIFGWLCVLSIIIYYNYDMIKAKKLNSKQDTTNILDWGNASSQPLNEVELH